LGARKYLGIAADGSWLSSVELKRRHTNMEEPVAVSAWIDSRAAGGAVDGGTVVRSPRYIRGVTTVAMEDGSDEIVD
jgi:hypothetical protein